MEVPDKDKYWGKSNMGNSFSTPKEVWRGLDKFVIGQERAEKVLALVQLLLMLLALCTVRESGNWLIGLLIR